MSAIRRRDALRLIAGAPIAISYSLSNASLLGAQSHAATASGVSRAIPR